jgi:hypothetical protein
MAMKMSMTAAMAASGHCDRYPFDTGKADAGKSKAAMCATVACASIVATLPEAPPMAVAEMATSLPRPQDEMLRGDKPPPNLAPPRTSSLS